MNPAPLALEIHIHLADGRVSKFAQSDGVFAQNILAHVHPSKLFSQNLLLFWGGGSMSALQTRTIERIDFITDVYPEWPFHNGAQNIQEVTEEEFRERYRPEAYGTISVPGELINVYAEIELRSGESVFVEIRARLEPRLPLEQNQFIQQLFNSAGLHARRRGSGVLFLNPTNVTRFTFYPGAAEPLPGSWTAVRLAE